MNGFAQINAVIPADLQYGGNLPCSADRRCKSKRRDIGAPANQPQKKAPKPGMSPNASGQIVLAGARWRTRGRLLPSAKMVGAGAFQELQ